MKLELELHENEINYQVKIPAKDSRTPFTVALSSMMSDFDESQWDAFIDDAEGTAILPLSLWRKTLRSMQRSWDYWRSPKALKEFFKGDAGATEFDLTPLEFTLNGVSYKDVDDIPATEDLAFDLGTFFLATPTLQVTDPCYQKNSESAGELPARTGEWAAQVIKRDDGVTGHSNAILLIAHNSVDIDKVDFAGFQDSGLDIGVDSAQAGFFEKAQYPDDARQLEHEEGTWYYTVGQLTCRQGMGGATIAPGRFGVVSQTFWGDGSYPCLVQKDADGQVIAAMLVFDGSLSTEDDEPSEDARPMVSRDRLGYVDIFVPEDYAYLQDWKNASRYEEYTD